MTVRVSVEGIGPFLSRLEKFDKQVGQALKKEMRKGAAEVSTAARKRLTGLPLSNWGAWNHNGRDLGYGQAKARGGIKPQISRYRKRNTTVAVAYEVGQKNPGGAVFEGAGVGNSPFVQNIVGRWGPRPSVRGGKRTLLPGYYEGIDPAQKRIEQAIRDAERKVGQ
jgi:hypothetical protein